MDKNKKYKIAIDISPLSDGNSVRGVGYFTKNLIPALQKEIKTNPQYKNFELILVENCNSKIENLDLIHYPFFDPFKLTLPKKKDIPFIVTVYDLIPREFKSHFPIGLKGEIKWLIQKNRLRQSDLIITSSNYSKYVIQQIVNYPQDRIYVTPGAADDSFRPINDSKLLKQIKKQYHLPDKFVLYVGDINWNKNIPNLCNACLQLDIPLVICGSAITQSNVPIHPWTKDLIQVQQIAKDNPGLIITPGFIPDEHLPAIFNLATLYCQPSYAEGFGLPVVQAMKSGCPVAYSIKTSLSEVVDYNGEFFQPHDLSDIKKSIKKLWEDPILRKKYSQMGLKRAQCFSWQFAAIQTLSVYQIALL